MLPRTSQLTAIDDDNDPIRRARQDLRSRGDGKAGAAGLGSFETMQQDVASRANCGEGAKTRLGVDIGGQAQPTLRIAYLDSHRFDIGVRPAAQPVSRRAAFAKRGGIEEIRASRRAQDAASGLRRSEDDIGERAVKNAFGDGQRGQLRFRPRSGQNHAAPGDPEEIDKARPDAVEPGPQPLSIAD